VWRPNSKYSSHSDVIDWKRAPKGEIGSRIKGIGVADPRKEIFKKKKNHKVIG